MREYLYLLGLFFYNIFLFVYAAALRLAALWNLKAKRWVAGRKNFPVFSNPDKRKVIWMHCASLGEFEQGRPLIEMIRNDHRFAGTNFRIIISFFSPSGYEVMKDYALADQVVYLPVDSPGNARKFITDLNPSVVLWVKYEFWYYYLTELQSRSIPVLLVSAVFRNNQPFFRWYGALWRNMLNRFSIVFLQNNASADLLKTIDPSPHVLVSGDTRFDRVIEISTHVKDLPGIAEFCRGFKIIVAGSTWEEDEAEWVHYVKANPGVKLIIAPHEVDRENLKGVQHTFPGSILYSAFLQNHQQDSNAHVLIIDNVGMLSRLYSYADVAYVGGGFGDDGVHNVLEAAVYGIPVIHGPEYEKYAEAVELVECDGSIVINSAVELEKQLRLLFENPDILSKHGEAARNYVLQNGGATRKIVDYIYENRLLTN